MPKELPRILRLTHSYDPPTGKLKNSEISILQLRDFLAAKEYANKKFLNSKLPLEKWSTLKFLKCLSNLHKLISKTLLEDLEEVSGQYRHTPNTSIDLNFFRIPTNIKEAVAQSDNLLKSRDSEINSKLYKSYIKKLLAKFSTSMLSFSQHFTDFFYSSEVTNEERRNAQYIFNQHIFTTFPPPQEIPTLMEKFATTLLNMMAEKTPPLTITTYAHMGLIEIYPFAKANGKVARLLANIVLAYYDQSPILFYYNIGDNDVYIKSKDHYQNIVKNAHKKHILFESYIKGLQAKQRNELSQSEISKQLDLYANSMKIIDEDLITTYQKKTNSMFGVEDSESDNEEESDSHKKKYRFAPF